MYHLHDQPSHFASIKSKGVRGNHRHKDAMKIVYPVK